MSLFTAGDLQLLPQTRVGRGLFAGFVAGDGDLAGLLVGPQGQDLDLLRGSIDGLRGLGLDLGGSEFGGGGLRLSLFSLSASLLSASSSLEP